LKSAFVRKKSMRSVIREIMDPFKNTGESTVFSLIMDGFIIICILAVCALIPLEYIFPEHRVSFLTIENWITAVFIVEYILRWYSADDRVRYPLTPLALVDLAAILPTLIANHDGPFYFNIIRSLRLIRLVKIIRYSFLLKHWYSDFALWLLTVKEKNRANQLLKIFFYALFTWIIGSNLIYLTEIHLGHPLEGPYVNYWLSYWNIIVILFSGIEDKAPLTVAGRFEAAVLLIAGICFAGLITGEIVGILVKHIQRSGKINLKPSGCDLENHIVIIGQNKHLHNVIRQIHHALKGTHHILVVSRSAEDLKTMEPDISKKVMALQGDALESRILEAADIKNASRVVLLSSSFRSGDSEMEVDNRTLMKTMAVLGKNENIPIVAELQSEQSLHGAATLEEVEFVVSRRFGERLISQAVLNPGVTEVYDALMTFSDTGSEFFTIPVPPELVGKTFMKAQLFFLDLDDEAIVLVGIERSPSSMPLTEFKLSPYAWDSGYKTADLLLRADDRLIIIANEQPSYTELTRTQLWRGKIFLRS
jgi:voltage-gated potassium channel